VCRSGEDEEERQRDRDPDDAEARAAYFTKPDVHSATTSVVDWRRTITMRAQSVSGAVAMKANTTMIIRST
jgi:hypothetical protein